MALSTWLRDDQLRDPVSRYFASTYLQDDWPARLKAIAEETRRVASRREALDIGVYVHHSFPSAGL